MSAAPADACITTASVLNIFWCCSSVFVYTIIILQMNNNNFLTARAKFKVQSSQRYYRSYVDMFLFVVTHFNVLVCFLEFYLVQVNIYLITRVRFRVEYSLSS